MFSLSCDDPVHAILYTDLFMFFMPVGVASGREGWWLWAQAQAQAGQGKAQRRWSDDVDVRVPSLPHVGTISHNSLGLFVQKSENLTELAQGFRAGQQWSQTWNSRYNNKSFIFQKKKSNQKYGLHIKVAFNLKEALKPISGTQMPFSSGHCYIKNLSLC